MYAKGYSPGAEEFEHFARYGYDEDSVRNYGMAKWKVANRAGQLWQPWYQGMLEQAGLQGVWKVACWCRSVLCT